MSIENRQFARNGGVIIKDTNSKQGNFHTISFYKTSVILEITLLAANGDAFIGSLDGEQVPAGYEIYGKITSIKLGSGACIAYNDGEE